MGGSQSVDQDHLGRVMTSIHGDCKMLSAAVSESGTECPHFLSFAGKVGCGESVASPSFSTHSGSFMAGSCHPAVHAQMQSPSSAGRLPVSRGCLLESWSEQKSREELRHFRELSRWARWSQELPVQ